MLASTEMSKTGRKPKHIPKRTCVGCREINPKRSLTRIVRCGAGVLIDPTGKMAGRGAYIHNSYSCWQIALKGKLAGALKVELKETDKKVLIEFMNKLPDANINDEQNR